MTYALELARRNVGFELGAVEAEYVARMRARIGYQRAMATCHATRQWAAMSEKARAAAKSGGSR